MYMYFITTERYGDVQGIVITTERYGDIGRDALYYFETLWCTSSLRNGIVIFEGM